MGPGSTSDGGAPHVWLRPAGTVTCPVAVDECLDPDGTRTATSEDCGEAARQPTGTFNGNGIDATRTTSGNGGGRNPAPPGCVHSIASRGACSCSRAVFCVQILFGVVAAVVAHSPDATVSAMEKKLDAAGCKQECLPPLSQKRG